MAVRHTTATWSWDYIKVVHHRKHVFEVGIFLKEWGLGAYVDGGEFTFGLGPIHLWWAWR